MSSSVLQTLRRVLEERDIPLNLEDATHALDDVATQQAMVQWTSKFLSPHTLLSKDEATFAIDRNITKITAAASTSRHLSDAEIETAIRTLEESTAAIEAQSRVLETQKRALQEITARNAARNISTKAQDKRQNAFARERAQIEFDTDELSQSMSGKVGTLTKIVDSTSSNISGQVERLLEKDDRLLTGLRKIVPKLTDVPNHLEELTDVDRLCSTLTTLLVEDARSELDFIYRRGLTTHAKQINGTAGQALSEVKIKQKDTLRAELSELGLEIESLSTIVVDQQYRKPLKQSLSAAAEEAQQQNSQWAEYSVAALMYLAARLDALCDHVQHLHTHRAALKIISNTIAQTIAAARPKTDLVNGASRSDTRASKGLKPLRLVQANLTDSQDPAWLLIRQLGLKVPESDDNARTTQALDVARDTCASKLSSISNATEERIAQDLKRSLTAADIDLLPLLRSVYTHSHYNQIETSDPQLQADVDSLEQRTQYLGDEMRDLDVEGIMLVVEEQLTQLLRG